MYLGEKRDYFCVFGMDTLHLLKHVYGLFVFESYFITLDSEGH